MKLTSLLNVVFFYFTLRLFLDGTEEFLILPTAWYYVEYLGQTHFFLGLLLGAYSVACLITSPIIGALDAKLKSPKALLIFCSVMKFIGHLLYTIPLNGYFPLVGRILGGIAGATYGVVYGTIAQATNNKKRAQAFLYFEGLYSVGLSFGSVIGSSLTFKTNIFGWVINAGNSPGLVLTIVWLFMLIFTLCLPRDFTESEEEFCESSDDSNAEFEHKTENMPALKEDCTEISYSRVCFLYFLVFQNITIMNIGFFYTPLLAVHHFGLNLFDVRFFYTNSALFPFVLFLGSYVLASYVSDKNFIAAGSVSRIIPISILLYFSLWWDYTHNIKTAYLLLICVAVISAGLVNFTFACSLLSKETPVNQASLYLSISSTVSHLSNVTSRVIAGATFNKEGMMYVAAGLSFTWVIELIWFGLEYRNLFPASKRKRIIN